MKLIKFTRGCAPYSAGETAGFEDGKADRLVESGVADFYEVKPEATSLKKRKKRRSLGLNRQIATD